MLKRISFSALALVFALSVGMTSASAGHSFRNCDALHRAHRYGVAKTRAAANRQVISGHYRPIVNRSLYLANDNLDADHDRTACEVAR